MKKLFVFLFCSFAFISLINAQTEEYKNSIGLFGGRNEYNGDLGNAIFNLDKAFYGFGALQYNRYLSPSFDIGLMVGYGHYGYYKSNALRFRGEKLDPSILLSYKFNNGYIMSEECKFSPSIFAGIGGAFYMDSKKSGKINTEGNDIIVPLGIGLKYQFSPRFALQYMCSYQFTFNDDRDLYPIANDVNSPNKKGNDTYLKHSLGIVFSFGKPKDTDGDGVRDKFDKCVDVYGLEQYQGCPDTDGDGIIDSEDRCPNAAGSASLKGCPDRDNDGIADIDDKCPDVPGIAKFQGCPDTDGDGIQDSEDRCPKYAGLPEFKGCPDTDGDGVPDIDDRCPTEKGPASLKGCPDTDGDGIPDIDDRCPTVPGIAANKGCPEVKEEVKKIFTRALQGIQFETGKDVIKPVSFPILNDVVKVMKENTAFNLTINGHTDNVGDDNANMTLSQRRADAVKKYLVDKGGIDENRMTAKGYGETMPVEDNKTAAGRAKNRRVEFQVIF